VAVRALAFILVLSLPAAPLSAQHPVDAVQADSLRADSAARPASLKAWQVGAVLGGAFLSMQFLDAPVHDAVQDMRSETTDDVAYVLRQVGEPVVWGTVSGGLALAGLVTKSPGVRDAGLRAGASVLTGLVVTVVTAQAPERAR